MVAKIQCKVQAAASNDDFNIIERELRQFYRSQKAMIESFRVTLSTYNQDFKPFLEFKVKKPNLNGHVAPQT